MTAPLEVLAAKVKRLAELHRMVSREVPVACDMNAEEFGQHKATEAALHAAIDTQTAGTEWLVQWPSGRVQFVGWRGLIKLIFSALHAGKTIQVEDKEV